MKQAAIGFRAHSGWAAVVAVCEIAGQAHGLERAADRLSGALVLRGITDENALDPFGHGKSL